LPSSRHGELPAAWIFALTADYERWKFDPEPANFRGSGPDTATRARIVRAEVHKYPISSIEAPP
jgi:hypothetical protein